MGRGAPNRNKGLGIWSREPETLVKGPEENVPQVVMSKYSSGKKKLSEKS